MKKTDLPQLIHRIQLDKFLCFCSFRTMKCSIGLLFLLIFLGFNSMNGFAQTNIIPANYQPHPHPRLLLYNEDVSSLKNDIAADNLKTKVNIAIVQQANQILDLPPVQRIVEGRRLLAVSREFLKRIFYLSYSYRITGELRYAERAEKEMLAVAAFSDWHPQHFLDVGEMTAGIAIGYDWIYDFLSDNTKATLANSIINFGINPSFDKEAVWEVAGGNNHNQVNNAGLVLGALAIYENNPTLARRVIDRGIDKVRLPMKEYEPDGAYEEGYGYWNYGTTFGVMMISQLEKSFGTDFGISSAKGFLESSKFMLNMTGPDGKCFNYGDCFANQREVSPAMFWFAKKQSNNQVIYHQIDFLKRSTAKELASDRIMPALLIWSRGIDYSKIIVPQNNLWVGQGECPIAVMRTSWTDSNAIFVGIKGGSPSTSHAHMDAGSFVIDAIGERWAMDLGPQEYNDVEKAGVDLWNFKQQGQRWQVFRLNNYAHNVLTVNDSLHRVNGMSIINSYSDAADSLSATTDITSMFAPALQSAVRTIAILDKKKVSVKDELINTKNPSHIRWTMLTSAKAIIKSDSVIELTQHHKHILLRLKYNGIAKPFIKSAKPATTYENQNKGVSIIGFDVDLIPNERKEFEVYFDFGK